ncbi:MAG: transglycosylase SLT domain-containing protein [Candidatus Amulumruptor caecigallinarius]|nr:transglycosylase SLT domain-containing protein [Candidatus Amulumruptor caecigallinarius]
MEMTKYIFQLAILASASLVFPLAAHADQVRNVLDVKTGITDSNIIFPESYEIDTQKMLEGWYMKNYTATDDRYSRQSDVEVSDDVIRKRLASLNTVIEMPFNQIVRSYIERYTRNGRSGVAAILGLSHYYIPIFEQALEENGLPNELKYLPVIESGLNPNAVSRHGATGLWQFMLATGKGLDMEISSLVDERRDPFLSSQKAAQYLKSLYESYNDWSLAIAAYNCGPGTVNKAIRRAGGDPANHDFWSIYYFLPAETRGYVPMFIAANYVMNYYPYHNISPVLATKPLVTDTLMISDRVHFNQISKVLDIPVDELRVLNPQFRADIIPGRPDKSYTLVLPSQQCHAYIMSEDAIKAYDADKYALRYDAEPGVQPSASDVRAVEDEAQRELAQFSAGSDDDPEVSIAPVEPAPVETEVPVKKVKPGKAAGATAVQHKVAPGETLSSIANKYGVTVADLKSWNNLTRNSVRTGRVLRVASDATPAKTVANAAATPKVGKSNTAAVAAKETNSNASDKNAGKKKSAKKKKDVKPSSHSVKSGENLTTIAKKYGVTVSELKKANGLSGDELHPGDKLKLPGKEKAATGNSKKGKKATGAKKAKKKRK